MGLNDFKILPVNKNLTAKLAIRLNVQHYFTVCSISVFAKRPRLMLRMMQGLRQQQTMLIFCLCANHDLLYLGIFLVCHTNDVLEVLLIEAFIRRNVLDILNRIQLSNNSIQWHIVCMIWFSISLAKHEPSTVIFFEELGMEGQFKLFLSEWLIGESQYLMVCNSLVKQRQQIDIRQNLL